MSDMALPLPPISSSLASAQLGVASNPMTRDTPNSISRENTNTLTVPVDNEPQHAHAYNGKASLGGSVDAAAAVAVGAGGAEVGEFGVEFTVGGVSGVSVSVSGNNHVSAISIGSVSGVSILPSSQSVFQKESVLILGMAFVKSAFAADAIDNTRNGTSNSSFRDYGRLRAFCSLFPSFDVLTLNDNQSEDDCERFHHCQTKFSSRGARKLLVSILNNSHNPIFFQRPFSRIYLDYFRFPGAYARQCYGEFFSSMLPTMLELGVVRTEECVLYIPNLHDLIDESRVTKLLKSVQKRVMRKRNEKFVFSLIPIHADKNHLYIATGQTELKYLGIYSNDTETRQLDTLHPFIKLTIKKIQKNRSAHNPTQTTMQQPKQHTSNAHSGKHSNSNANTHTHTALLLDRKPLQHKHAHERLHSYTNSNSHANTNDKRSTSAANSRIVMRKALPARRAKDKQTAAGTLAASNVHDDSHSHSRLSFKRRVQGADANIVGDPNRKRTRRVELQHGTKKHKSHNHNHTHARRREDNARQPTYTANRPAAKVKVTPAATPDLPTANDDESDFDSDLFQVDSASSQEIESSVQVDDDEEDAEQVHVQRPEHEHDGGSGNGESDDFFSDHISDSESDGAHRAARKRVFVHDDDSAAEEEIEVSSDSSGEESITKATGLTTATVFPRQSAQFSAGRTGDTDDISGINCSRDDGDVDDEEDEADGDVDLDGDASDADVDGLASSSEDDLAGFGSSMDESLDEEETQRQHAALRPLHIEAQKNSASQTDSAVGHVRRKYGAKRQTHNHTHTHVPEHARNVTDSKQQDLHPHQNDQQPQHPLHHLQTSSSSSLDCGAELDLNVDTFSDFKMSMNAAASAALSYTNGTTTKYSNRQTTSRSHSHAHSQHRTHSQSHSWSPSHTRTQSPASASASALSVPPSRSSTTEIRQQALALALPLPQCGAAVFGPASASASASAYPHPHGPGHGGVDGRVEEPPMEVESSMHMAALPAPQHQSGLL